MHTNECCVEYQLEEEFDPPPFDVETVNPLELVPSVGVVWKF